MANTTPTVGLKDLGIDADAFKAVGTQVQDLNERITQSVKVAALASLSSYEQAVQTVLELEEKAAASFKIEGMSTLVSAHVSAVKDATAAYLTTARGMLN
jgi:hypothetical protein